MWANCVKETKESVLLSDDLRPIIIKYYGWPRSAIWSYSDKTPIPPEFPNDYTLIHSDVGVAIDAIVALAILTVVWHVCEAWIRYREGRRN